MLYTKDALQTNNNALLFCVKEKSNSSHHDVLSRTPALAILFFGLLLIYHHHGLSCQYNVLDMIRKARRTPGKVLANTPRA